ncbi:MAG: hypothetical protein COZ18_11875 [Flexibacter sp. CG_4_10_14_3_um_filter_32_15]|nr:MAG: hypothetical protein COZ18_11875 [Flexibacter sp. CG_4_10_14_3_um_filter_32_15]
MEFEPQSYTVKEITDISKTLKKEDEVVSISVDVNGVNILLAHSPIQYRTKDGMSLLIRSKKPKDYTFLRYDLEGNQTVKAVIKDEYFNFRWAKFLPTNEIILITSRCEYRDKNDFDKNAKVYNLKGELERDFTVGDGLNDVRIDKKGNVWTSYFEEGIYGNYGWGVQELGVWTSYTDEDTDKNDIDGTPLGASGLVCWSNKGEKIWSFKPVEELDYISDSPSINIDDEDNTWLNYYIYFPHDHLEYPLVKLNSEKQMEFLKNGPIRSSSYNILGNKIVAAGYYFELFEINGQNATKLKDIIFKSKEGIELNKSYIKSFGSHIGFFKDQKIYLTNVSEVV